MVKFLLYMHTGSGNHGCEALLRTTAGMLGASADVELWSLNAEEDLHYGAAAALKKVYQSEQMGRVSLAHAEALIRSRLLRQSDGYMKAFLHSVFRGKIAVAIGGDNYCYPWSAKWAVEWNRDIRKVCSKTVLWGCSIDPEAVTPEVRADLAAYDLITARETLSYDLLKEINPHTVLVSDPAFTLEAAAVQLPEHFIPGNTVGINVSPLIMKYGTEENVILKNYEVLIQHILEKTDMNVCLIPHVVWAHNDDRVPLRYLFEKFYNSGRVSLAADGTCQEIKGIIAQCRFFVGARTHATIAAYSSCVPTLAVGYSTKSRGIAMDLFGTQAHYVLPVQQMKAEDDLLNEFEWLVSNREEITDRLASRMPQYVQNSYRGREYIHRL